MYGFSPETVKRMTPEQQLMYLELEESEVQSAPKGATRTSRGTFKVDTLQEAMQLIEELKDGT